MARNKYKGVCYRCGETVDPGEGHYQLSYRHDGKFILQHADCAIKHRGSKKGMKETCTIYCCGCGGKVEAIPVTGKNIYPHRPDLSGVPIWACPNCDHYVGCHKGTRRPLGHLSGRELRNAKMYIHALLDPIWQNEDLCSKNKIKKKHFRTKLYRLISDRVGYNYHTGTIRNIEEARNVYRIVRDISVKIKTTPLSRLKEYLK